MLRKTFSVLRLQRVNKAPQNRRGGQRSASSALRLRCWNVGQQSRVPASGLDLWAHALPLVNRGLGVGHTHIDAVLFQLAVDSGLADAEELGGARAVAPGGLQRLPDGLLFQCLQRAEVLAG